VGELGVRSVETGTAEGVFLTFDDGTAGCYDCAAPELESLGWRGHFFITTSWTGRPGFLDRRQIAELRRRGHVIGSHSVSHPERLSKLSRGEILREWSESCRALSEILDESVTVASVPGGYCSRTVCEAAAAAGIKVLFTSEPTVAQSMVEGCLVLGRYAVLRSTTAAVTGAMAAGDKAPRYREASLWLIKKAAKRIGRENYLRIRRALLARNNEQAMVS
jgi:peptidoglycan/xylan/chitin deacetylase (PgdA/CDA1 family)